MNEKALKGRNKIWGQFIPPFQGFYISRGLFHRASPCAGISCPFRANISRLHDILQQRALERTLMERQEFLVDFTDEKNQGDSIIWVVGVIEKNGGTLYEKCS